MILLVTSDAGLHARLAHALSADDSVMLCEPGTALPRSVEGGVAMAVLDCRSEQPGSVRASLDEFRRSLGSSTRCVAIAPPSGAGTIQVIVTNHGIVLEAILPDVECVDDLLRAHFNDATRSACSARVLELLERLLPPPTHDILHAAIDTGFSVSSEKQLAGYLDEERTTTAKRLRKLTNWTPSRIIKIAQASVAVLLLRDLRMNAEAVSEVVKYSGQAPLRGLLVAKFAMSIPQIVDDEPGEPAIAWLEGVLRRRFNVRAGCLTPAAGERKRSLS